MAIKLFDQALQTTTSAVIIATITDFEEDWEDEDGDFNAFFKLNSLQELITEYKSNVSEEYHYGVLLKSDRLLTLKHKLTILTKAYILSSEVSDETKGLLKDALHNMYQADRVVCENGIENLEFFIEKINHNGTKNSIDTKLKNAIKEFEKAEEFINKGLALPASKAYQKSYVNVLEGFGKGGIYFTDEYLLGETDSDEDGLTDGIEYYFRTNPFNTDTDGDGLSDYQELLYGLDPLKPDTDGNGILDIDEDLDGDGLSIGQELLLGTDPLNADTDGDGLSDGDEINIYFTDPLKADTDGDGLNDGDEIALGLNPLVQDTDGNGILDSEEKILQTLSVDIIESEKPEIIGVSVTLAGTGNLNTNTTIESVYGIDMLSSEVVGLIGVPVEILSDSQFDEATITFSYNDALLGETNEADLAIMWYDEENNFYQILDEDSVIDPVNNTISYTTTHFSTYLVVDREQWYEVWINALSYIRNPGIPYVPTTYFDISYVVDSSGSMSGSRIATAKEAIGSFIDAMYTNDRGSLVSFQSVATVMSGFTNDQAVLKAALAKVVASGGTSVNSGLVKSIELFESNPSSNSKMIILLCDGDVNVTSATIQRAITNNIKIYPVLIGSILGNAKLQDIANQTGGTFYYAATAEEIRDALFGIQDETIGGIDTTDTDGDGLYDIYETAGMIIPNGKYLYSDPLKVDTDADTLNDDVEMGNLENYEDQSYIKQMKMKFSGFDEEIYVQFFDYRSDPYKKDTDGDGYEDDVDPRPLKNDVTFISLKNDAYVTTQKDGVTYYGGSQMWFSEDDWWSVEHILQNYGCGTIAASDLFLYWAIQDSTNKTDETGLAYNGTIPILSEDYCDYVRYINAWYTYTPRWIGVIGPILSTAINNYSARNDLDYKASWKISLSDEEMYTKISSMLKNDIPVIFSIGPDSQEISFYSQLKKGDASYNNALIDQLYQYKEEYKVSGHYVTVTGMIEDKIAGTKMLKISSWGKEYYVNYEEYREFVNESNNKVMSSIVYITDGN